MKREEIEAIMVRCKAFQPNGAMREVEDIIVRAARLSVIVGHERDEIVEQVMELTHTTILSPIEAMGRIEDRLIREANVIQIQPGGENDTEKDRI